MAIGDVRSLQAETSGEGVHINPSILPGWMYARALALRVSHDAKVSYSVDIDDFHRTFLSSNGN